MRRLLSRVCGDAQGVASLEFVIILPIMFMLLIGIYQLTELVRAEARLSRVAVAVADLVGQQAGGVTGGTSGSVGNFCAAAELMMTPFPTTGSSFSLSVASVTNYSPNTVTVDWEIDTACATSGTHLGSSAATLVTTPVNLLPVSGANGTTGVAGDSVIIVQAQYTYASLLKYLAPTLGTLSKLGFARPRANAPVSCTASCS